MAGGSLAELNDGWCVSSSGAIASLGAHHRRLAKAAGTSDGMRPSAVARSIVALHPSRVVCCEGAAETTSRRGGAALGPGGALTGEVPCR